MSRLGIVTVSAVCVAALGVLGAQVRQERVHFKPGTSSASLTGTVQGYATVDYVLGARRGQSMSVSLKTRNGANYFNVLPPGSEEAIANGSMTGNSWTGALPADGDYRIRVYLMRSAARRNEKARFTLTVGITGGAAPAAAHGGGDAKVAGTPFHATGKVPCSVGTDAPGSAQCSFGVIRQGGGRAEVHLASPGLDVTQQKDGVRVLRFSGGTVTAADPKHKVTFQKRGDEWSVTVDGLHHYTIADAVVVGG